MGRTRVGILEAAGRAVEKYGVRRATMGDVASVAGIAKGTLYNHFRTKEAVYAAAVEAAVHNLGEECITVAAEDLAEALALAADRISGSAALRRIATEEPTVLSALTSIGEDGAWVTARGMVCDVLRSGHAHDDAPTVDLVLRWLVSFVAVPGRDVEAQSARLAAALATTAVTVAPAPADTADTSS